MKLPTATLQRNFILVVTSHFKKLFNYELRIAHYALHFGGY